MSFPDEIITVTELNSKIKALLERGLEPVWIEAEIASLTCAASGHIYMTLQDPQTQIRAVLFARQAKTLPERPTLGQHVLVLGQVTTYPARGEYQLIVQHLMLSGQGQKHLALAALKAQLEKEGIFRLKTPQEIPKRIYRVGVCTSAQGAVWHDIRVILAQRAPGIDIILYPCLVQGNTAVQSLQNALRAALLHDKVDLVILGRGGGSQDDLQAFNDESLVRMVAHYPLPLISATGHETDTTLCDYAANMRAATPSAAAQIVSEGWRQAFDFLQQIPALMAMAQDRRLERAAQKLTRHRLSLARKEPYQKARRLLVEGKQRLVRTLEKRQQSALHHLEKSRFALRAYHKALSQALVQQKAFVEQRTTLLTQRYAWLLKAYQQRLEHQALRLQSLSPHAVLQRGYSFATFEQRPLSSASACHPGQVLTLHFYDGSIQAKVLPDDDHNF